MQATSWRVAALLESIWRMPRDISTEGHRIDGLIHVTLVFVGVLFAALVAWLAWVCLRHGARHPARFERGDTPAAKALPLGLAAAVLFVVDGNLFVNSTRDMGGVFLDFERHEADPEAVRIEVNARQWAWDARYSGPDGRFNTRDDIVTLNEIRVPVGAPVLIQLGAVDVIHSLYLPNVRVKVDAVPGMVTRTWFQATEPGSFEIGCAQHCGTHHYKMRGELIVLSKEEYAAWARTASAQSALAFDPDDHAARWGWEWKRP